MQMIPQRIPVLFPDSLRSQLFLVKINSEAADHVEKPVREREARSVQSERPAPFENAPGVHGVPISPLND